MTLDIVPVRRALLSVTDKTGLAELGAELATQGIEILSTGGSARVLLDAGVPVREVSDFTGFPEILDGRVKTLVPQIHGGLLGRRDVSTHVAQMNQHGILPIDLLVVNLYDFKAAVANGADFDTCIERIDIGGPALLRAAAKNFDAVAVVSDPTQYSTLLTELEKFQGTRRESRQVWAGIAYARTAAYDSDIASWFAQKNGQVFPSLLTLTCVLRQELRYGENPHQQAAFYVSDSKVCGLSTAKQLQGRELSFNNLNDADAAFECVSDFAEPTVAIIKHANPCGVSSANDLAQAWELALRCDPVSAFGGVVAVNRVIDEAVAAKIAKLFTEVIIAPDVTPAARVLLGGKKHLRLLTTGGMPHRTSAELMLRSVSGGYLIQSRDDTAHTEGSFRVVTDRQPTDEEMADMLFAFRVCKHTKSNSIVFAKGRATVGIGAGQMSRVDSARIAAWKGNEAAKAAGLPHSLTKGSVVASDAFFPFADGLETTVAAGATAIIQPGGSVRDAEVIAAGNAAGVAMIFTGIRHFRH